MSLAILLTSVAFLLSIWIVLPAPTSWLLPLGVGAPELSPALLVVALAGTMLALPAPYRGASWIALVMGLGAVALSMVPLLQLARTERQLGAAMRDGLGPDFEALIAPGVRASMRARPFALADVFRGIAYGEGRIATRAVQFASAGGVPLRLIVYQPRAAILHPIVIVVYGGAWQHGAPTDNPELSRYFATRGYTVFAIDYRHAPLVHFPAPGEDVRTAIDWVRQHAAEYDADAGRIALLGRSAGAHLAMLAAYAPDAPPVRAVVSYYGPTDLARGYAEVPHPDPIDVRATLRAFVGGTPEQLPEEYRAASPITYAAHPLPPTLLVQGARDHVVLAGFARSMQERFRARGTTSVLLEIPWSEHAFDYVWPGIGSQVALYHTERFLAWALRG